MIQAGGGASKPQNAVSIACRQRHHLNVTARLYPVGKSYGRFFAEYRECRGGSVSSVAVTSWQQSFCG
jgi:hypothetical protein